MTEPRYRNSSGACYGKIGLIPGLVAVSGAPPFLGAPLREPDEAAIAIEFARRRRRLARSAAIINSIAFAALLLTMALVYEPPVTSTFWFMAGVWLFGLIASPVIALLWRHKLQQWEERNRRVLTDADG